MLTSSYSLPAQPQLAGSVIWVILADIYPAISAMSKKYDDNANGNNFLINFNEHKICISTVGKKLCFLLSHPGLFTNITVSKDKSRLFFPYAGHTRYGTQKLANKFFLLTNISGTTVMLIYLIDKNPRQFEGTIYQILIHGGQYYRRYGHIIRHKITHQMYTSTFDIFAIL